MPTTEELLETVALLEDALERKLYRKLDFFKAYPKQQEFFDLGAFKRERLLIAGNQLGKSEAGSVEATYHLTGLYPPDWMGLRFTKPVRMWIVGVSSLAVRDIQQKKLCGAPGVDEEFGTGYIPRSCFVERPSLARGVTDAYDTMQIKWHDASGKEAGVSTATFKSYEQGRLKFQGEPVDFIWCDEEPPPDIYSEIVTRTSATYGAVMTTFTPLQGMSDVVRMFIAPEDPDDPGVKNRGHVTMTIYDALHYTPEQRAIVIAGYPAHEREARANGVPMLGSGAIFPFPDEMIMEDPLAFVPPHWAKLWGVDFGIDHPFGAVLILWDKDNDVIHVHSTVKVRNQTALQHAAAMKPIGGNVPVAWPHDGNNRDKGSGEALAPQYKAHGLKMLGEHATWPDGGYSTEAGIMEMVERITTGRLKVARHLGEWFEEKRLYHRKDGQIVKINDDLLSATRIAIMQKRSAKPVHLGPARPPARRNGGIADGVDFDVFG